jgi:hypothetical protein
MARRAAQKITFTGTNASEVEVTGLLANNSYDLVALVLKRTGGTAANWTPLVGDKTGFTDDPNDGRRASFSASALTTIDHQFDPPIAIRADANGKIYIKPQWDAGSDNDCAGHVMIRRQG